MTDSERELFDTLLEQVIEELPAGALDEMPLIVDDSPDDELLSVLEKPETERDAVCGAFLKIPRRRRSVLTPFRPDTPSQVYLFREGVVRRAGGWSMSDADDRVAEQIRTTLREQLAVRFEKEKEDATRHWRAF